MEAIFTGLLPCCAQPPKLCGTDSETVARRALSSDPSRQQLLAGSLAVVTGATLGGIGAHTARVLAGVAQMHVVIGGRRMEALQETIKNITDEYPDAKLTPIVCDLANLESTKTFAKEILSRFPKDKLRVLVNNAAVMATPYRETKDGNELQMGTNHLGHFLLTGLLETKLKESAPARIVCVSSAFHIYGDVIPSDLNMKYSITPNFEAWQAYGRSKTANIYHAIALSDRLKGSKVTAYSLHPGFVDTNLGQNNKAAGAFYAMFAPLRKTVSQGAATSIYCALQPGLESESGKYFINERLGTPLFSDVGKAKKVFESSEAAVASAMKR